MIESNHGFKIYAGWLLVLQCNVCSWCLLLIYPLWSSCSCYQFAWILYAVRILTFGDLSLLISFPIYQMASMLLCETQVLNFMWSNLSVLLVILFVALTFRKLTPSQKFNQHSILLSSSYLQIGFPHLIPCLNWYVIWSESLKFFIE